MSSRLLTYSSCAQWPGLGRGWAEAGPGLGRGWTGAGPGPQLRTANVIQVSHLGSGSPVTGCCL